MIWGSFVNYKIIMIFFSQRIKPLTNVLRKKVHIICIIAGTIMLLLSETAIIVAVKDLNLFTLTSKGSENIQVRVTCNIPVKLWKILDRKSREHTGQGNLQYPGKVVEDIAQCPRLILRICNTKELNRPH